MGSGLLEECESGRIGTIGNRVKGDLPWVQIPPPPPASQTATTVDVAREYSVEAELVTLDVVHYEARLVGIVGGQESHTYRAEREQTGAFGLKCGQTLFSHETGADSHVKMQSILNDLAYRNALKVQSRARTGRIDAREP